MRLIQSEWKYKDLSFVSALNIFDRIPLPVKASSSESLFAITLIFFNLVVIFVAGLTESSTLSLSEDGAAPEVLNYAQTIICIVLLLIAYRHIRVKALLVWALFFTIVVIDDAFMYHERFGAWLDATAPLPRLGGLRLQDTGELLAWGLAGAIFGAVLLISLFRTSPYDIPVHVAFAPAPLGLLAFGVAADMAHILFGGLRWNLLGALEDGGEMLVLAASASIAYAIFRRSSLLAQRGRSPARRRATRPTTSASRQGAESSDW